MFIILWPGTSNEELDSGVPDRPRYGKPGNVVVLPPLPPSLGDPVLVLQLRSRDAGSARTGLGVTGSVFGLIPAALNMADVFLLRLLVDPAAGAELTVFVLSALSSDDAMENERDLICCLEALS